MKHSKKALSLFLLSLMTLTACGDTASEVSSGSEEVPSSIDSTPSSERPSSSELPSSESSDIISVEPSSSEDALPAAQYEAKLNGDDWESDHLYIHYLRESAPTYEKWHVWSWQYAPIDNEGQIFNWEGYDQAGAYTAIDLNDEHFKDAQKIGFLIVLTSSVGGSGHWTSDSGGNVYVDLANSDIPTRPNGTIHLFATEGRSISPTFKYSDEVWVDNPFSDPNDDSLVSKGNINSSGQPGYDKAPTSPSFLSEAGIGYQIQVSSFADSSGDGFGDIKGITNKLPYLDELNVDVLWLTPVQESGSYHGYDTIDYLAIDPKFGTMADYEELLAEADALDIKVIMDLVINHTDLNHDWFKKSALVETGLDSNGNKIEYRDFYHWRYSKVDLGEPWYRYATTNYHYYGKFGSSMPELNYDNQATRDAIIEVAKFWLEKGVAGFRLDAVKHIYMAGEVNQATSDKINQDFDAKTNTDYSTNETKNLHFFNEFNYRLKTDYPNAFIVGENFDGWDQRIKPYYQGMDSQLDFAAYYHFVNNTLYDAKTGKGENSANVEATQVVADKYAMFDEERGDRAINSGFTSNHDIERMLNHVNNNRSGSGATINETNTPITDQNDDEAGLYGRLYAAATLLQPGLSFIYYGDEIGMSGNIKPNTKDNSPQFAVGTDYHADRWYRQPMKWSALEDEAITNYRFSGYSVEWDDYNKNTLEGADVQKEDPDSMLSFFQAVTNLKGDYPVFTQGTYQGISQANEDVFGYELTLEDAKAQVFINFGNKSASLSGVSGEPLLSFNSATRSSLPAYSILVTSNEAGEEVKLVSPYQPNGPIEPVDPVTAMHLSFNNETTLEPTKIIEKEGSVGNVEYQFLNISLSKDQIFTIKETTGAFIEGEDNYPTYASGKGDGIGYTLAQNDDGTNKTADYLAPVVEPDEAETNPNNQYWCKYINGKEPGGLKVLADGTYNLYIVFYDNYGWVQIYVEPAL